MKSNKEKRRRYSLLKHQTNLWINLWIKRYKNNGSALSVKPLVHPWCRCRCEHVSAECVTSLLHLSHPPVEPTSVVSVSDASSGILPFLFDSARPPVGTWTWKPWQYLKSFITYSCSTGRLKEEDDDEELEGLGQLPVLLLIKLKCCWHEAEGTDSELHFTAACKAENILSDMF